MKFGKRLSAEAERQWRDSYIDYKACKRAIQADVEAKDPLGHTFHSVILQELDKVSAFYQAKEEELQAGMLLLGPTPGKDKVASFASQVLHLRKYVVLNYVCVVKACKKRNRHLRAACGEQVASVHAVDILSKQYFFTSPKLASMATQAEILTKGLQPVTPSLLQDYQCPICLSTLRGPVVLTCVHRFCWGCIVTHCTTLLGRRSQGPTALGQDGGAMAGDDDKGSKAGEGGSSSSRVDSAAQRAGTTATWEGEQSDDEHTLATFDCPVCRKAQLLNLDRLQVDPHLDAFVRKLEQQGQGAVSSSSTVTMLEDREDMVTCEPQHDAQPSGAPATPHGQGGVSEPATSTVVAPLSVEAMDAVVEYLHKEHQALQEESRLRQQAQQTVAAHPPSPEHVAAALPPLPQQQQQQQQRAVSQPMTISSSSPSSSSKGQQPESWRQQGLVDDMEVDSKPSMHSRLLAASEASAEEVSSQLRSVPAPVPAAIIPSRQQEPQVVERRPPHAATVISQAPARLPAAAPAAPKVVVQQAAVSEPPLLPPQRPQDVGKLTVCLDLDGTLVSTFTPKRAPLLPPSAVSYVVGRGGKLNPGGVFVVERPGLLEFFRRIAPVAEVVLFTAGLEDYAAPICDALEAKYNCFLHRLYRPACVPDEVYPCIKDMSRLGRDLKRCVLVDDTPLAFFRQPDNGIPVLNFRGDVDDQLLAEAVAPLIESLAGVPDVRIALSRRFNMTKWFQAQGLMVPKSPPLPVHRTPSMPVMHRTASGPAAAPAQAQRPQAAVQLPSNADVLHEQRTRGVLLICDFDKTLTDNDAGERLCDELAPELTSLLTQLEMPANFVPVTNTVLAEMQRRGVSRDRILATLHKMGGEVPLASVRMLQWASRVGIDVRVLSDCNSVVINSVLAGAKVNKCVREIITNYSAFQRVDEVQQSVADLSSQQQQPSQPGSWLYRTFGGGSSSSSTNSDGRGMAAVLVRSPPKQATQRLVVTPRHPYHECSHGCPLCPENLCKGQEMEALWKTSGRRQRTIYCGDGANDLCPALRLGPQDVVLARKGYQLDHLISKRAGAPDGVRRVVAQVELWETHEDLWRLVQEADCI